MILLRASKLDPTCLSFWYSRKPKAMERSFATMRFATLFIVREFQILQLLISVINVVRESTSNICLLYSDFSIDLDIFHFRIKVQSEDFAIVYITSYGSGLNDTNAKEKYGCCYNDIVTFNNRYRYNIYWNRNGLDK